MISAFSKALGLYRENRSALGLPRRTRTASQAEGQEQGRQLIPEYTDEELLEIACEQPASRDERRRSLLEQIGRHLQARQVNVGQDHLTHALAAMARVPREEFVPEHFRDLAYLPMSGDIGHGQTISNPHLVAVMTAALEIDPRSVVLDVGTGSGYHAAVLAEMAEAVVSVEIVPALGSQARARLAKLGYANIEVLDGDGVTAAQARGPFDAIVVAAGAPVLPAPLLDQLAVGGSLVMPVGKEQPEELIVVRRNGGGLKQRSLGPVRFVPLTGTFGRHGIEHGSSSDRSEHDRVDG